jgi:hypothetical protein
MVLFYSLAKIIKIGMENHFIRIYLISFWINRSESDIIGALPNAFLLFMPTKLLILRFDSPRWIVRWGGASSYSFFFNLKVFALKQTCKQEASPPRRRLPRFTPRKPVDPRAISYWIPSTRPATCLPGAPLLSNAHRPILILKKKNHLHPAPHVFNTLSVN